MSDQRGGRPGLQRVARPHPLAPESVAGPAPAIEERAPAEPAAALARQAARPAPVATSARRGAEAVAPTAAGEPWVPLSTVVRRSVRKRLKAFSVDQERAMQLICDDALAEYLDAHGG